MYLVTNKSYNRITLRHQSKNTVNDLVSEKQRKIYKHTYLCTRIN